jgi:hypothetical protein
VNKLFSDLTRDQYLAIGKVVVQWAHVEEALRDLLASVAGFNDATTIRIVTHLKAEALWKMLLTFAHEEGKPDDEQRPIFHVLIGARTEFDRLRNLRNEVAHQPWLHAGKPKHVAGIRVTARERVNGHYVEYGVADIEKLCDDIGSFFQWVTQTTFDYRKGRLVAPTSSRGVNKPRARRVASRSRGEA